MSNHKCNQLCGYFFCSSVESMPEACACALVDIDGGAWYVINDMHYPVVTIGQLLSRYEGFTNSNGDPIPAAQYAVEWGDWEGPYSSKGQAGAIAYERSAANDSIVDGELSF